MVLFPAMNRFERPELLSNRHAAVFVACITPSLSPCRPRIATFTAVYGSFDAHNLGFTVRYDYDSVISIFTLGRIYLLVGFFAELYGFRSAQAR